MNIASLVEAKINPNIPELAPGDTVKVSAKIVEGDKERIQPFQGVVTKIQNGGNGASFTVRRVAYGVGVERTFPIYSPTVEKVEIIRHGKVNRAKLYYLRERSGKSARIKERRVDETKRLKFAKKVDIETEETPVEPQDEQAVQTENEIEPVEVQNEQPVQTENEETVTAQDEAETAEPQDEQPVQPEDEEPVAAQNEAETAEEPEKQA